MSFFEITCNLEAYRNDFEFQALPLELQTKWLVSCNGFVKIDGFEKVQFFKKEKSKNEISAEDLEELRKMEEILNRPNFNN